MTKKTTNPLNQRMTINTTSHVSSPPAVDGHHASLIPNRRRAATASSTFDSFRDMPKSPAPLGDAASPPDMLPALHPPIGHRTILREVRAMETTWPLGNPVLEGKDGMDKDLPLSRRSRVRGQSHSHSRGVNLKSGTITKGGKAPRPGLDALTWLTNVRVGENLSVTRGQSGEGSSGRGSRDRAHGAGGSREQSVSGSRLRETSLELASSASPRGHNRGAGSGSFTDEAHDLHQVLQDE